jgi:hypothetical protein
MATLSGQTIQNTYDGLLKLEDSTNGITSSLQNVEDGLGNDTGLKISTTRISHPSVFSLNHYKPEYMGNGFNTSNVAFAAGIQNTLRYTLFADTNYWSYSAITIQVRTATTTNDTIEAAFYSSQYVDTYGVVPKDLIMSGITFTGLTTTGLNTVTLPSHLSFSAQTNGIHFMVFKIINSGATPTVRVGQAQRTTGLNCNGNSVPFFQIGTFPSTQGTVAWNKGGANAFNGPTVVSFAINNLDFQTSYSSSDVLTNFPIQAATTQTVGFGLKVV